MKNKYIVYTALFGKYDKLLEIHNMNKHIDYVCFTNNKDLTSRTWNIIYVDDNTNDVLNAVKTRLTKIFGKDFNVTEAGTVESFLETEKQQFIKDYNLDYNSGVHAQYATAEEFAQAMMNLNYYNEDAYYSFVTASNISEICEYPKSSSKYVSK